MFEVVVEDDELGEALDEVLELVLELGVIDDTVLDGLRVGVIVA